MAGGRERNQETTPATVLLFSLPNQTLKRQHLAAGNITGTSAKNQTTRNRALPRREKLKP